MQPCVHCFIKINHLDKDILRRIYIKQLQKQASVCEPVMQLDHTTRLHHRAGPRNGEKKEKKSFDRGSHGYTPQNIKRSRKGRARKTEDLESAQRDPLAGRIKLGELAFWSGTNVGAQESPDKES